ncbi:MAG: CRISPR-associated endonuclease Cas3'' [Elusimicrobia bacterium]|nr:CRISPR-associated endonuclease Cas3'' [Elusimicrobiota bacterium]
MSFVMTSTYLAHSANSAGTPHLLKDHLSATSRLASEFLGGLQGSAEAGIAGLLHDVGKYADAFQARLRGEEEGLDHWTPGAWAALTRYKSIPAALAIQGHHIGLQSSEKCSLSAMEPARLVKRHPLGLRLSDADIEKLVGRLRADDINLTDVPASPVTLTKASSMLDVRMIFSALVDADFLDTEAHFSGGAAEPFRPKGPDLQAEAALAVLEAHVAGLRATAKCDQQVRQARDLLWEEAGKAGGQATGAWTMTAPTGSGKTLAMLRFALEHALAHGLRRVVVAIPYLSIIEQTAGIFQGIFSARFGDLFVLEHHSLARRAREIGSTDAESPSNRMRRLLSENWDAPIIVTTNVQLLESLFSNRPSSCRKLHRLARSVILFDEAQSLPPALMVPTLQALTRLCSAYGSSVVFATATQPALEHLDQEVLGGSKIGWTPRGIVGDEDAVFSGLRRVRMHWPAADSRMPFEDLAGELAGQAQALCIVNLKRHAMALMKVLRDRGMDAVHLSTNMCPAHRKEALEDVRRRLGQDKDCRLISTQCVEAGVDLDFPVVYRAMGPLEAIAQAAGRCNRNGLLRDEAGRPRLGDVRIFIPALDAKTEEKMYPSAEYWQASCVVRSLLAERGAEGMDLAEPSIIRSYFQRLYDVGRPHESSRARDLSEALERGDFAVVAELYRLIPHDAIQVLVPYEQERGRWRALKDELSGRGARADWMRRAQDLCVSIFRPGAGHPVMEMFVAAPLPGGGESDEWFVLAPEFERCYDPVLGFSPPKEAPVLIG